MKRIVAGNSISAPQAGRRAGRHAGRSNGLRSLKPAAPAVALLALAAGSLLLAGCEPTGDLFSEYRGTNLIPDAGFDSDVWELVAFEDGSTPLSDADLATYALVEPVTDGSASADTTDLPSGTTSAEIRRLELKNLFPNGDFDTADASAWAESGVNATASIVTGGSDAINGNGLRYDIAATDAYILYQLNGAGGLVDATSGTFAGKAYTLRFDMLTEGLSTFGHNDGASALYTTWSTTLPTVQVYDFREEAVPAPEISVNRGGAEYFSINVTDTNPPEGNATTQAGTLDNIRVARSDISVGYRAIIPLPANTFGDLNFLNGPYRFSVYVRRDPTHTNDGDNTSDNVSNRFPSQDVTLSMGVYRLAESTGQPIDSADVVHIDMTVDPETGEDAWSSWTQVSVVGGLQVEDADYSDRDLAIVLKVAPTDTLLSFGRSPGSLLIAEPTLEFLVDPPPTE